MSFVKIKDLLNYKKNCSLCDSVLIPFLRDHGITPPYKNIPNINSRLTNDKFDFRLKYTSSTVSCNNEYFLDVNDNCITLKNNANMHDLIESFNVLNHVCMYIELHCTNKKCKYNYYLMSAPLKYKMDSDTGIKISNPFHLDSECYNLSTYWIINDLRKSTTNIFSTIHTKAEKVSVPILELNILNKDKVFNRIKTIINFG